MEPFRITIDTSRRTLHVSISAYWDDATARRFAGELKLAAGTLRREAKTSYWLIDASAAPPQSQATTSMLRDTVAHLSQHNANYVAVIAPSALVAMQARRVGTERHEVFGDRTVAETWLSERRTEGDTQ